MCLGKGGKVVMERFGCCSLYNKCIEEKRCVAEQNLFLTPDLVKEYPAACSQAKWIGKLSQEVKQEEIFVEEKAGGQISFEF